MLRSDVNHIRRTVSAMPWFLLLGHSLFAQEADDRVAKMQDAFVSNAKQFQVKGGSDGSERLQLVSRPVLSWSNPQRRTSAGAMFFWTHDGRPQVAMCMYPTGNSSFDIEFQSLSSHPLSAVAEDGSYWRPVGAGIEFRTLEGLTGPGASVPVRLRQMRNLARSFSAQLVPPKKTPTSLRLMSNPIYRYAATDASSDLVDGSVFSFVQATDPEVLLVIEAVNDDAGKMQWRYGLARMSMVPMQVMRDKTLVWEEANWAATRQSDGPYYVIPKFQPLN